MKKIKIGIVSLLASLALASAGCYIEEDYYVDEGGSEVYVEEAPPREIVEVETISPGPEYFWIGGYWIWRDRWVWNSGRWSRRPNAGSTWESSHWNHDKRGWSRSPGHWRH